MGKTIFLYGLYTVAAVVFFLYALFPSETVSELIVAKAATAQPNLNLDIDHAYPAIPPGLRLEPMAVAYGDMPIVRMPYLKVFPGLISMLREQKTVSFNGPLGSGTLNGRAELALSGRRPQNTVNVNLTNVPMSAFEVLDQWPDYDLDGEVTAYIQYDSLKGAGGTADIKMDIMPAKITFDPPVMGIEQIEFTQLQAEMVVTPRMIQIKRCEASGLQMEGRITGSIIFRRPLQNSRITLSCTLRPQPAFLAEHKNDMIGGLLSSTAQQKRGLIFRIAGTLGNPNYVLR